jgi:hypothetical protein
VVIGEDEKNVGLLGSEQGKCRRSEDEGDEFHGFEPTERIRLVKRSTA